MEHRYAQTMPPPAPADDDQSASVQPAVSVRGAEKALQSASNQRAVRNAIANLCLAGPHMSNEREAALGALDLHLIRTKGKPGSSAKFVILLSKGSSTLAYRGLFAISANNVTTCTKLHGWGPKNLASDNSAISGYFKFDSSKRGFVGVSSKTFGGTVDAVCIDPSFLNRRKK